MEPVTLAIVLVAFLLGLGAAYLYLSTIGASKARATRESATKFLEEARTRQKEILLEAKDEAHKIRQAADAELRERRSEVQRQERRIQQREEQIERKLENIERKEETLV